MRLTHFSIDVAGGPQLLIIPPRHWCFHRDAFPPFSSVICICSSLDGICCLHPSSCSLNQLGKSTTSETSCLTWLMVFFYISSGAVGVWRHSFWLPGVKLKSSKSSFRFCICFIFFFRICIVVVMWLARCCSSLRVRWCLFQSRY